VEVKVHLTWLPRVSTCLFLLGTYSAGLDEQKRAHLRSFHELSPLLKRIKTGKSRWRQIVVNLTRYVSAFRGAMALVPHVDGEVGLMANTNSSIFNQGSRKVM